MDPEVSYTVKDGRIFVSCSDEKVLKQIMSEIISIKKIFFEITLKHDDTEGNILVIKNAHGGHIVGENLKQVTDYLYEGFFAVQLGRDGKPTEAQKPQRRPVAQPKNIILTQTNTHVQAPKKPIYNNIGTTQIANRRTMFEVDPETGKPKEPKGGSDTKLKT